MGPSGAVQGRLGESLMVDADAGDAPSSVRWFRSSGSLDGKVLSMTAVLVLLCAPPRVVAQGDGNPWHEGTMLSGIVGVGRESGANPLIGGSIAWEMVPHLAIEGRGTWLRIGDGAGAFAASVAARVPLRPGRRVVPFVSGGVGLHRATFDSTAARGVPAFFRRRMTASGAHTFDDFAVFASAGTDVYVTTHLAIRPEISTFVVRGPSSWRAVPAVGLHLAYHFENHFVTPSR